MAETTSADCVKSLHPQRTENYHECSGGLFRRPEMIPLKQVSGEVPRLKCYLLPTSEWYVGKLASRLPDISYSSRERIHCPYLPYGKILARCSHIRVTEILDVIPRCTYYSLHGLWRQCLDCPKRDIGISRILLLEQKVVVL